MNSDRLILNLTHPPFLLPRELDVDWANTYINRDVDRYRFRSRRLGPVMVRNLAARYLGLW